MARAAAAGRQRFQTERATSLTGLLSDGVGALLEDREGNIWAGTTEGLSRLTPRRITQLTNYGLVVGIEMTPDRNVWVGTIDELLRFSPGDAEIPSLRVPLKGARLRAMHADERGTIWVATDRLSCAGAARQRRAWRRCQHRGPRARST